MGYRSWPELLSILVAGQDLSAFDTAWAMREIIAGAATPTQIAAFATTLRAKGESADEIEGLVSAVLDSGVELSVDPDTVDIVGTGGDQADTVNISTMAAIVVAAAGIPVIKHGARGSSSRCGSADLLAALGIPPDLPARRVVHCVERARIGFCYAPRFHPGLHHAATARREIGVPTVFNLLAPLVNPARPRAGAIGCADRRRAPVLADVLARRGCSALVVRGDDGLDEVTTCAPTRIWVVHAKSVRETTVDALDLGITRSLPDDLRGGDAAHNAAVACAVLSGQDGPVRDAVVLNAAAAIAAHRGLAGELGTTLTAALAEARSAIDSGAAAHTLNVWRRAALG